MIYDFWFCLRFLNVHSSTNTGKTLYFCTCIEPRNSQNIQQTQQFGCFSVNQKHLCLNATELICLITEHKSLNQCRF